MMIQFRYLRLFVLLFVLLAACRGDEASEMIESETSVTTPTPIPAQPAVDPGAQVLALINETDGLPRPKVIGRSPAAEEELALSGVLEIYFDQPMDSEKTAAAWQVVDEAGEVVAGEINFPQPRILQFRPERPLQKNSIYQARLGKEAASASGLTLLEGLNMTFNTVADLTVSQTSPTNRVANVEVDTTITVIFNRPVVPLVIAEEQAQFPELLSITPAISGQGEWVNTSVYVFRPSTALQGKTTYEVRVLAEAVNQTNPQGSELTEDVVWSFTTAPPTYSHFELVGESYDPRGDYRGMALNPVFRIFFDQPMNIGATETAVTFRPILNNSGPNVPLTYGWDDLSQPTILTITPTQQLQTGVTYELALATTAESASGGSLGRGFIWDATTVPFPYITSARYVNGRFEIKFSSPMDFESLKDKIVFEPAIDQDSNRSYGASKKTLTFYGFEPSTDYTVQILPGMRDPYGNEISEGKTVSFRTLRERPFAYFGFPSSLVLLRQGGPTEMYVSHRNIDTLDVAAYSIEVGTMMNLLFGNEYLCSFVPPVDQQLWGVRRTVNLPNNEIGYTPFDLAQTGEQPELGLYLVTLDAPQTDDGTICDRDQGSVLAVVNANVTLKKTTTEALVWVTDLETGRPLSNVPVTLYTRTLREVASGVTDETGLIYWPDENLNTDWRGQYVALTTGDDVFGMAFTNWDNGIYPRDFGIQYNPNVEPNEPAVYVYTDRPLYRPGQPVSFKGIVRLNDDLNFSLPGFDTVKVVISSFDETIFSETMPLSEFGSFERQIMLDHEATLGSYNIKVKHGTRDIGYGIFDVGEYRKPTFQVSVTADKDNLLAGDSIEVTVEASYFAGGSVANADLSWSVASSPYTFRAGDNLSRFDFNTSDSYSRYHYFYDYNKQEVDIVAEGVGTTDSQGRFTVTIPTELLAESQAQQLTIEARINDSAGNLVSGRTTAVVHPAELYAGIRSAVRVSSVGEPVLLEVALVDWAAEPVSGGTVTVELLDRQWSSVQEVDANGRLTWHSEVQEISVGIVEDLVLDEDGRGTAEFTVPHGGVYKALVSVRDSQGNLNQGDIYLWVSGRDFISWRRTDDNNFELVADRDEYRPGDTAEILIASPFQGPTTALVTVERGHIKQYEVLELTNNSTIYHLPVTSEMAPNVIVSVLVVKGIDEFNPIPDFKVGMVQFGVEREEQELIVTITPDKTQVGPGDTVEYSVQVTDHDGAPVEAELSLALADLAALSLSDRRELPILDFFYAERFLSVSTALLLNRLIDFYNQELLDADSQGGADGKGSVADLGVQRIRQEFPDTTYWQGQLQTGADGRATVAITLPDNLTTWRMDVRAVTLDTKVGQAVVDIESSRPLRLQPQTPRFFIVGDQVQLGTQIVNTTEEAIDAVVSLSSEGATLLDSAEKMVTIPANSDIYVTWDASISDLERVDLVFRVESGEYSDASIPPLATLPDGGLPVYRYEVYETVGTSGQLSEAGAVVESIGLPVFPDWEISEATVTISAAPSLAAAMTDGLGYLEHYQYECTEQTISRFLPNVLTTRALREAGIHNSELETKLSRQVEVALQRIYSRQKSDGGWPWWESGPSSPIVSAYVVLGLVEAKEAGYTVSEGVITSGQTYLRSNWRGAGLQAGRAKFNRQAFITYVLSRAGADVATYIDDLYEERSRLDIYGRAYLAQTIYYLDSGDPRLEGMTAVFISEAILSATGTHWEEESVDYWNWNTDTRTTAIVLAAMAKIDPHNPLVANAVRWLMAHRTDGRWQGTQETAWVLIGLTEFMVASGELAADYAYEIGLNEASIVRGQANADTLRQTKTIQVDVANLFTDELNRLTIARSEGGGNLYYTAYLEAALPVEQVDALVRGIVVSRRYFRDDEPETAVTSVNQGETFLARLTIVAPNDLHYVMVEDFLPAGLEAIDASLNTSQQVDLPNSYDWNSYLYRGWGWWIFDHVEMRDEKVALSANYLPAGTYEYVYPVRAIIPGEYRVIPPTAWELYFPDVYGRGDGSLFVVTEP